MTTPCMIPDKRTAQLWRVTIAIPPTRTSVDAVPGVVPGGDLTSDCAAAGAANP
ncbi:hypothetical protein [Variovorax sp. Root411]|uniref:hypothetical protein n=1 Tax=Variovorax sp. Root411 TaxID=1736530 RepID=UPI0012F8F8D0|nr:hypothetical protein [Variovorax sp. Root411]